MNDVTEERGPTLLRIARQSLRRYLESDQQLGASGDGSIDRQQAWLQRPGSSFVTLRVQRPERSRPEGGWALRGCMGSLEPVRSVIDDVEANAVAAAVRDPRFPPTTADELDSLRIEVSLLSALQPMAALTEDDVIKALRPGVDGLVLECGRHRSTFLPQVWRELEEPGQFLLALKRKAGLPADFWAANVSVWRYTVGKWIE